MEKVLGVTLAISLCLAVVGCKDRLQEQALRKLHSDHELLVDSMRAKETNLAALHERLEAAEEQRKKVLDEKNSLKGPLDDVRRENEKLRKETESLKKEFDNYKNRYKASARKRFTGQQVDRLSLKSGVVYDKVTIKMIEDDSINIMHANGAARVPASELDVELVEKLAMFASTIAEETPMGKNSAAAQTDRIQAWSPSGIDDVADCSLMVWITSITAKGTVGEGAGSAFLCNVGDYSYIYTNAHNLDGVTKVAFKHADGRTVDDFSQVEIAKTPFGYFKKYDQGGDVVRIRLQKFRPKALALASSGINLKSLKESDIYITGNTKGRGEITKLTGKITEIVERNILMHNVATQAGNSGSPIVRASDCKVIGILTWGMYDDEKPFDSLWLKQPDDIREGINCGPLLYDFEFEPTSFERLKKQRLYVNETRKLARMLGLMDAIIPAHTGLFISPSQKVSGEYSVGDILEESADHRVIKRLVALHRQLEVKADSKIPYANKMILRFYQKAMQDCTNEIIRDRQTIESDVRQLHFFFKGAVDKSNVLKVCRAYESAMDGVLAWYNKQASLSGDPLPLSERVRLPRIEGGFAKYLKDE
jgi:hypothetical protein